MEVLTVGHSTHALSEFVALLARHGIEEIADVRMIPRSRRVPHFDAGVLPAALGDHGIVYRHLRPLAGRRRPRSDSVNTGWENEGFRGFADHMQTDEFEHGIADMLTDASERRVAVMCAEGLWWRCHRRLISDALTVRGITVRHISPSGKLDEHRLTEFAVVEGARVTYPAPQGSFELP